MNEEEAIERLKERVKLDRKIRNNKIESDYEQFCENECQAIETILNLADKQHKEIKKEKNRIMELAELLDKQENEIKFLKGELEIQEGRYISKDKIREKIEEITSYAYTSVEERECQTYARQVLKDLLEEK